MSLVIAAVRTGHDPVGKLPEASFHTQLPQQILCPKCDAAYNLIVDFEVSVGRFFERESAPLIRKLEKAVFMGHSDGHRVVHFETNGVVVTAPGVTAQAAPRGGESSQPESNRKLHVRPSRLVH